MIDIERERAAFEAVVRRSRSVFDVCFDWDAEEDRYVNHRTESLFRGWRLARAAIPQACDKSSGTYCLSCRGEGIIGTGCDEASSTMCSACDGTGYEVTTQAATVTDEDPIGGLQAEARQAKLDDFVRAGSTVTDTYLGNPTPHTANEFKAMLSAEFVLSILAQLEAAPAPSEFAGMQFRERMNDGSWGKWRPWPDDDVLVGLIADDHEARNIYEVPSVPAKTGIAASQPVQAVPDGPSNTALHAGLIQLAKYIGPKCVANVEWAMGRAAAPKEPQP